MSARTKYLLVSLPQSISPSNQPDEALTALRSSVHTDLGTTYPFTIPTFKIGALDALIHQADELAKLSADCEAVVGKVGDSLSGILEGDKEKIAQQKTVNDKPVDQYLETYRWNKTKYRTDKPIVDVADTLRKEAAGIDTDVRQKYAQYNAVKNNLTAAQRKQTGNLTTRSLLSIVNPATLVTDSEYLETQLVAVPNTLQKDFMKSYESLVPMVVPRSCTTITSDSEHTLYGVTLFKKHSSDFVLKARERRWTPRDFRYEPGGKQEEEREVQALQKEERTLWGEALRLGRTGYSDAVMTWVHVLALRCFVEAVLRYGLPPEFVCGLVKTTPKLAKKARGTLDATYQYLGGNAFSRDSKGRVQNDDSAMSSEMQAAGQMGESDYSPYVCYEFELN